MSVLGKQVGGLPVLSLPCVGGRMVRRCKSLIPICYCSRNSSLSLTPSTNPYSGIQDRLTLFLHKFTLRLCAFHLGFGLF